MFKPLVAATAALSMMATPALANPAAKLSLRNSPAVRAATALKRPGRIDQTALIAAIAGAVIGVGAILLSIDSDNDSN